ncbi:MAG: hypothetical protein HOD58_16650 [Gammaproteobacteria bacterium]|jgi:deoxycytidylate deaminase|nr:hypothetical protein [Gammaproteobacteria bacterium]
MRLSNKHHSNIRRAIEWAERSDMKVRVGAVMNVAGKISGHHNRFRNRPALDIDQAHHMCSYHAEEGAISNAYNNGENGTITIARLGKTGNTLPSFPCDACLILILKAGVRKIVWYNGSKWQISTVRTKTL